jgi:transcriptional regulator with XRE-family HTH domain
MTPGVSSPTVARIGERLREARLNARLTVRAAAERVGLRTHATLVQYENGRVLPPLDRLAALAQAYDVPLASLVVSHDALVPVVTLLERATVPQISAFAQLLQQVVDQMIDDVRSAGVSGGVEADDEGQ